jgi:hypothetical protein
MCTLPHQYSTPQVIHDINCIYWCCSEEWTLKGKPKSVGRSVCFYIQQNYSRALYVAAAHRDLPHWLGGDGGYCAGASIRTRNVLYIKGALRIPCCLTNSQESKARFSSCRYYTCIVKRVCRMAVDFDNSPHATRGDIIAGMSPFSLIVVIY